MTPWGGLAIAAAYILGLLATGITEVRILGWVSVAGCSIFCLGVLCSLIVPRIWRMGPTRRQWWIAGLVGLIAASYCIARSPQPAANDISHFASDHERRVLGKVLQTPQTSRNQKAKFFLEVQSVRGVGTKNTIEAPRSASGKLYVSAALAPSKRLYPGKLIELRGKISAVEELKSAQASGFGDYLVRQGCFASFRTFWIEFLPNQEPPQSALWKLRARIVSAQNRWLDEPAGNLLSAMTLGRKAVDLPFEVRDSFISAGLAHTLAASGFHVSLILTLVLCCVKSQRAQTQAIAGAIALIVYIGLTGLQPSVVRAAVMGGGMLLGLATSRKVNPLSGLLLAAVLILLFNPQWIWDIGFQLSVVATLGLILTVPRLIQLLDWLPVSVAMVLAVPIAAYLWTIPLQLLYFQVLPTYSVLLNGITTPLVTLISMGGFISAIAAIPVPLIGSFIASTLYYPIHILIWVVDQFNQLPGSSLEFTGIEGWHVVVSYLVYMAICIWLRRREQFAPGDDYAALF
ncbi:Competence protein [Synechococcus sp. PCC 7335]|uniref:ComEC/Rec2 family competence protein n=1 Tax=Synechococcus sp. (strain ATCC 29403 / PCC 7335) TaxID=91464 RepID=UPI00017EDD47|nr:ComEC/Rec2 family competence protein [Synechococcus sp. PCC 7335]EDX86574.1 Competence protein [Synechococcus sp. PCC 7335]